MHRVKPSARLTACQAQAKEGNELKEKDVETERLTSGLSLSSPSYSSLSLTLSLNPRPEFDQIEKELYQGSPEIESTLLPLLISAFSQAQTTIYSLNLTREAKR